jgi:23S rRNA pseudouridine2605 synthase
MRGKPTNKGKSTPQKNEKGQFSFWESSPGGARKSSARKETGSKPAGKTGLKTGPKAGPKAGPRTAAKSPMSKSTTGSGVGGSSSKAFQRAKERASEELDAVAREYKNQKPKTSAKRSNKATPKASAEKVDDGRIRLNKFIANAGICSRREADDLIGSGVVTVNGKVITELGYKIFPSDQIMYGGTPVKQEKLVYVLLNKPKDYITTVDDPQKRKTVLDLVRDAARERIYPVGRLDRNTTGLLLLTNDGELTKLLTHPRYEKQKLYHVELDKPLHRDDLLQIRKGIQLDDGLIEVDDVQYVEGASKQEVGISLHSGKNRIVRRIFEHLGYFVKKLDRVAYAGLTKKDLPRGRWRHLSPAEVARMKKA